MDLSDLQGEPEDGLDQEAETDNKGLSPESEEKVAQGFHMEESAGAVAKLTSLKGLAELDCCVTVVDASNMIAQLNSIQRVKVDPLGSISQVLH